MAYVPDQLNAMCILLLLPFLVAYFSAFICDVRQATASHANHYNIFYFFIRFLLLLLLPPEMEMSHIKQLTVTGQYLLFGWHAKLYLFIEIYKCLWQIDAIQYSSTNK